MAIPDRLQTIISEEIYDYEKWRDRTGITKEGSSHDTQLKVIITSAIKKAWDGAKKHK